MRTYEIKGMVMRFDVEKEKDIIEYLKRLASQHKLGDFLASLVRAALSNDVKHSMESFKIVAEYAKRYGLSPERKEFFDRIEKQLREMKAKIDAIYEKAVYVYTLETAGKYLGVKERAKQLVLAEKVLEEQFKLLCSELGVSTLPFSFKSDKDYIDIKVENLLQGLLDRYGNILGSATEKVEHEHNVYNVEERTVKGSKEVVGNSIARTGSSIPNSQEKSKGKMRETGGLQEDDEVIDFGDTADWDLLDSFISPK